MYSAHPYFDSEPFARIYDKAWAPQYCERIPILEKLLLPHLPKEAQILDLCCGTGKTTQQLILKGYQTTGLDEFKAMLHYADQNAPSGKFILSDIRNFELPSSFHGVFSITHGLDYVMNLKELTDVFHNVYKALLKDGLFLLFMRLAGHSQFYYARQGAIIDGNVKDEYAWAIGANYDPQDRTAELKCTAFELIEENWQRSDFRWLLKSYSRAEIQSALEKVGFTEVHVYDHQGDLAEPGYERIAYFVCRK